MQEGRRFGRWAAVVAVASLIIAAGWTLLRQPPEAAVGASSRAESLGFSMGTVVRVTAEGDRAEEAVAKVMAELDRLTPLFDRFRPYGDISALNAAGGDWVEVTPEVLELLEEALKLAELSGGAFDPTVAPVVDLWGFIEVEEAREGSSPTPMAGVAPPDPRELEEVLKRVDYRGIEIDRESGRVRLTVAGQAVDLGAVAKGYGADRAAALLRQEGVLRALIDLGGDVYALGTRPDGTPWRLGIRHPRAQGKIFGILRVSDAAVATSGDYERYFEYEGVRYSHIVDPRTGWPAQELASVTVVAPSGVWADALSTAAFVLGVEKGMALLESLPGVDGVFIDDELKVYVTSGLVDRFERLPAE